MRYLFLLLALWLPLSLQAAEKISVVTSFSILADMTREVGGEHIELTNLVGPDADAHLYEPSPDDAQALLRADLIIANRRHDDLADVEDKLFTRDLLQRDI